MDIRLLPSWLLLIWRSHFAPLRQQGVGGRKSTREPPRRRGNTLQVDDRPAAVRWTSLSEAEATLAHPHRQRRHSPASHYRGTSFELHIPNTHLPRESVADPLPAGPPVFVLTRQLVDGGRRPDGAGEGLWRGLDRPHTYPPRPGPSSRPCVQRHTQPPTPWGDRKPRQPVVSAPETETLYYVAKATDSPVQPYVVTSVPTHGNAGLQHGGTYGPSQPSQ